MKQMGLAQFCKRRNPHEPVSEGGDAPNLAFLAGSAASAVGLDDSTSRAVANEVSAASSTRAGKGKSFPLEERRQIGQACRDRAGDLNRTLAYWNDPRADPPRRVLVKGTLSRLFKKFREEEALKLRNSLNGVDMPAPTEPNRGRPSVLSPEESATVMHLLRIIRASGGTVTSVVGSATARALVKESSTPQRLDDSSSLGPDWARKYLGRHGWALRSSTTSFVVPSEV